MNQRQLEKLGVPPLCLKTAIMGIQAAAKAKQLRTMNVKAVITEVVKDPQANVAHPFFGQLAQQIIDEQNYVRPPMAPYKVWGNHLIDPNAIVQMERACSIPVAVRGAAMPDGHVGYGLNIGGVLALRNAVSPYCVGVDIACRMKLSLLDVEPRRLKTQHQHFCDAVENGTFFGIGAVSGKLRDHSVMDQDWNVSKVTKDHKDKAWRQLGTSGSGNHFCVIGIVELPKAEFGLEAGEYVAILTHSGSRGAGAAVCATYSAIAQSRLHSRFADLGQLAWLEMDTQAGLEYWAAMNLMGDYAAANHDIIHKTVSKLIGSQIIAGVENHHNFCWKETYDGEDLYVHRKGATPAGKGVLGIIPSSMGKSSYVVRGLGNPDSLNSASHGAGRVMSRTAAKEKYTFRAVQRDLAAKGITILSAGADEVPGVYKDLDDVMAAQSDLVEAIARFDPKIVKMCGDGSKAED